MCLVSFSKKDVYSALKKIEAHDKNPKWAYIVICDNCSHKCAWCYGGFNESLDSMMSYEDFNIILAKCKEIGVIQITIAGGEPTEHPRFMSFVALASEMEFLIHIASHGEHITFGMADKLKRYGVKQVQLNFQGSRYHDLVHGVRGSYLKSVDAVRFLKMFGIEVTVTITVGQYNLLHIGEIFSEADGLGVDRLRVWEATGVGNPFRKNVEARLIFEHCKEEAAKLGYTHVLSYDPDFIGDVNVSCLQLSGLFMYITSTGQLRFCGAVPEEIDIGNLLIDTSEELLAKYHKINRKVLGGREPFCVAREATETRVVHFRPRI